MFAKLINLSFLRLLNLLIRNLLRRRVISNNFREEKMTMKTFFVKIDSKLFIVLFIVIAIHAYAIEPNASLDPLIEYVSNQLSTDEMHNGFVKLARQKKIAGVNIEFLSNYSIKTDKLPVPIVEYIDRALTNTTDSHHNIAPTHSAIISIFAFGRFVETGNLDYLRLALRYSPNTDVLGKITSPSSLYERYLREETELAIAKYMTFLATKRKERDNRLLGHGIADERYIVVLRIDELLRSAIKYKKSICSGENMAPKHYLSSDYLFTIFLFAHSELFLTDFRPQRWQEFATTMKKDCGSIYDYDGKFCYCDFSRISDIFQQEFKDTKYAEQLKRLIGDEKEWKSFLACCEYVPKAKAEIEAETEKAIAKLKAQQKQKTMHSGPKSTSTNKETTKTE